MPTAAPITMLENLEADVALALNKAGVAEAAANANVTTIALLDAALNQVEGDLQTTIDSLGQVTLQEVLDNGDTADKGAEFGGKVIVVAGTEGNEAVTFVQLETVQNDVNAIQDTVDSINGDYVKKSGDEMTGNLHILKVPVSNADITNVPLVIARPLNEGGSIARFRIDSRDVLKINNEGQLECENNRIVELGAPVDNTDAATKKYADDIGRAANDYTSSSISQVQIPDTSDLLKLNGTRAMTGVLSMGNNTIGALATPVSRTDAANKGYVEDTVDTGVANPQMQLQLWQYKGLATSETQYQALRAGEFMIKKTDGGEYNWQVAINVKDRSGKYWYPYNRGTWIYPQ